MPGWPKPARLPRRCHSRCCPPLPHHAPGSRRTRPALSHLQALPAGRHARPPATPPTPALTRRPNGAHSTSGSGCDCPERFAPRNSSHSNGSANHGNSCLDTGSCVLLIRRLRGRVLHRPLIEPRRHLASEVLQLVQPGSKLMRGLDRYAAQTVGNWFPCELPLATPSRPTLLPLAGGERHRAGWVWATLRADRSRRRPAAYMTDRSIVPAERVERAILVLHGRRVMLDANLAALYGVETKCLSEQVKRNLGRFPVNLAFQLTAEEYRHLRSQNATSSAPRAAAICPTTSPSRAWPCSPACSGAFAQSRSTSSSCARSCDSERCFSPTPSSHASSRTWSGSTTRSSVSCSTRFVSS